MTVSCKECITFVICKNMIQNSVNIYTRCNTYLELFEKCSIMRDKIKVPSFHKLELFIKKEFE